MAGKISLVSSTTALRASAQAGPMPLPARSFAKLLLLGGATLALIGVMNQLRAPAPSVAPARPAMNRAFDNKSPAAPSKPSVFAQEAAMSSSELMKRWEPLNS